MSELILHHYPPSPVSEKVRIVFGIKHLAWRSVEIPRLPPRPLLFPLTGGYRRTPVLQVGADIYCDSALILAELERRHPRPSLFPDGERGLALGLARWLDGPLFDAAVTLVLGSAGTALPAGFAADRVALYFGAATSPEQLRTRLPQAEAQVDLQFGWLAERLRHGRAYFCGESPGMQDAEVHYLAWFLAGRWPKGQALLAAHPPLAEWEARMLAIGHGSESAMSAEDALAVGRDGSPAPVDAGVRANPEGLAAGQTVTVTPDGAGMDPSVAGELLSLTSERVSLGRLEAAVGEVNVHFPRAGYRVAAA